MPLLQGHGWQEGEVRRQLAALIEQYSHVPKQPEYVYQGPPIGECGWPAAMPGTSDAILPGPQNLIWRALRAGEEAQRVVQCWQALPKVYPPANWRPPPPAGFVGATGMRVHALKPWKSVSCLVTVSRRHGASRASSSNSIEQCHCVTCACAPMQAGADDGSCFVRPMTNAELHMQAQLA